MTEPSGAPRPPRSVEDVQRLKLETGDDEARRSHISRTNSSTSAQHDHSSRGLSNGASGIDAPRAKASRQSPVKVNGGSHAATPKMEVEETIGASITLKVEPGQAPKLARTASTKTSARPPQLFDHLPQVTDEATKTFECLTDCTYQNKYLGITDHALECDCNEEWGEHSESPLNLKP
ncbi:hypothetical protein MRB53_039635 [Persea americana]|nr:hypothetical protein MRB53_039635 [Persea americana]